MGVAVRLAPLRTAETVVLGVVLLLAAFLRVAHLGALPLFYDESIYTRAIQVFVAAPSFTTWLYGLHNAALPLFPSLAAPLTALLPNPVLAARLTSAIIGLVAVLGVWASGRTWAGPRLGVLAAFIYTVCPFSVFYSRMGMLDGPVAMCGAWALFYALRLSRSGCAGDMIGLSLCVGAGLLGKLTAISMVLLPILAVVTATPSLRPVVTRRATLALILAVLPLLWLLSRPETRPLIDIMRVHTQSSQSVAHIVAGQLGEWADALWLYLTPPIIIAAFVGLGAAWRERSGRLVIIWAACGGLLPALAPEQFLAPRYFLYISVPIVLLAAWGLIALALVATTFSRGRHLPGALVRAAIVGVSVLVVGPSAIANRAMLTDPHQIPLTPFDRWQYVTGWPSGYTLQRLIDSVHGEERSHPVAVFYPMDSPPGDSLPVPLRGDARVQLYPIELDVVRRHAVRHIPGRRALLILFQPADRRQVAPVLGWQPILYTPAHVSGGAYMIYEELRMTNISQTRTTTARH